MSLYNVLLEVRMVVSAYVEAESLEEAEKKAKDWSNLIDEQTEHEEIEDVLQVSKVLE